MTVFKFLNRFTQCKHTIEVRDGPLVFGPFRCMAPPEHPGFHQTLDHQKRVVKWFTNRKAHEALQENYGKPIIPRE